MKILNKKLLKIIGNIFTVVCVGYIAYKLITLDIDYSLLLDIKTLAIMLVCIVLLAIPPFLNSIAYKKILQIVGIKKIALNEIIDIYSTSNMGKYLPGNIMHLAGRNVLGSKYGLDNKKLVLSTFFEIAFKIILAAVSVFCFSFSYIATLLAQGYNDYIIFIIVAIILVVVAGLIIVYKKAKGSISNKKFAANLVIILWLDAIVFLLNIICFLAISAFFMGFSAIQGQIFIISGIYLSAWLVGYLTPGAPGGIGVKEAALVFMLSGIFLEGDILFIGIVLRVCNILGDLLAYAINKIFNKIPASSIDK